MITLSDERKSEAKTDISSKFYFVFLGVAGEYYIFLIIGRQRLLFVFLFMVEIDQCAGNKCRSFC